VDLKALGDDLIALTITPVNPRERRGEGRGKGRGEGRGDGRGDGRRNEGRKAVDVELKGLEDGMVALTITPIKPRERPPPREPRDPRERRPRNALKAVPIKDSSKTTRDSTGEKATNASQAPTGSDAPTAVADAGKAGDTRQASTEDKAGRKAQKPGPAERAKPIIEIADSEALDAPAALLPSSEEVTPLLAADTLQSHPSKPANADAAAPGVAEEALAKALGTSTVTYESATAGPGSPEVAKKPAAEGGDSAKNPPTTGLLASGVAEEPENPPSSRTESTGITSGQPGAAGGIGGKEVEQTSAKAESAGVGALEPVHKETAVKDTLGDGIPSEATASLEAAKEAQPAVGKVDPTPEGSEVLSKGKEGPGGMLADVEGAVSSAIDFAKEKTADLTTQTDKEDGDSLSKGESQEHSIETADAAEAPKKKKGGLFGMFGSSKS